MELAVLPALGVLTLAPAFAPISEAPSGPAKAAFVAAEAGPFGAGAPLSLTLPTPVLSSRLAVAFDRARPAGRGLSAAPEATVAVERTAEFQQAWERADEPASAAAKSHDWLFAPGYMWDFMPTMYEPNVRALRGMGLDARFVRVRSTASSSRNAADVIAAIEKAARPISILAHSKGARDVIAALHERPDLAKKVKAIVAIQTPFHGTDLPKILKNHPLFRMAVQAALRLARHPISGLKELLDDTVQELCGPTGCRMPDGVRWVSVATTLGKRRGSAFSPIRLTAQAMKRFTGKESDGVVATDDMIAPDSEAIRLDGMSHADTVMDPAGANLLLGTKTDPPYPAERFTRALVHYLFP